MLLVLLLLLHVLPTTSITRTVTAAVTTSVTPCLTCSSYIRAGSELTWDYNYDVGSVPGKILYCYCGSAECRGRLL